MQGCSELRAPDAPHHRTGYDGRITVLADRFKGKRLNSAQRHHLQPHGRQPVVQRSAVRHRQISRASAQELAQGVYRIDSVTGELALQLDDLQGPNGLAFSPTACCHREPGLAAPADLGL
jgi:gluconolactonase